MIIQEFVDLRILLVDDSKMTRHLALGLLKEFGINEVYQVPNAAKAIKILEKNYKEKTPFDLIFTDINMPGLNGVELLRKIKEHRIFGKTPIIMMSSVGDQDTILQAVDHGADEYIIKPITAEKLEEKIKKVFPVIKSNRSKA